MNKKLRILFGIIFVLFFVNFIYAQEDINLTEEILEENVTREDALLAIEQTGEIIEELLANNFSAIFANDSVTDAKRVFEQAENAEILRNQSSSVFQKNKARRELGLVDWENIFYADVLVYTDNVKERRDLAFFYKDIISLREKALEEEELGEILSEIDLTRLDQLLEEGKIAFDAGRYDEVERLLIQIQEETESKRAEFATLVILRQGARNFFQDYWPQTLIFLLIFSIIAFFSYKRIQLVLLKKGIQKLKIEKEAILSLIKKVQEERFKQNKISESVYDLKMKKYNEKLESIKINLPIFESELLKKQERFTKTKIKEKLKKFKKQEKINKQ